MTPVNPQTVEEHTLLRPSLLGQLKERFAGDDRWLRNPSRSEDRYRTAIWMHGTLRRFQEFRRARGREHYDWDGHLGTHFTNSTWAAQMYAVGELANKPRAGGRIAVCLLRATAPAAFELRSQVTVSALTFALREGLVETDRVRASAVAWRNRLFGPLGSHTFGFQKRDFSRAVTALVSGVEPPGTSLHAGYVIAMEVLNDYPDVAARFVDHLQGQGFDSIVCNTTSPEETTAIVFNPKQVVLLEWQSAWPAVLDRVRKVRAEIGDRPILIAGTTNTVENARRASGKRRQRPFAGERVLPVPE